ncbi:MAG: cptB [Gammaproteobacteria bacterium]|jgi:antitoxin CptB|nr:cptB [Gammaproteobacteria bacterium]
MSKFISSRLSWACRRGMLELDLLLGNFLHEAFETLSPYDQKLFIELLEMNDQDLFLWLTGKEVNNNHYLNGIIKKIRYHAEHRHSIKTF